MYAIFLKAVQFQHAHALELLKDRLKPGSRALDVGSGSGYLTVCMALMVGPSGRAVGIDHIKELVDYSISNVKSDHPELLDAGNLKLIGKMPVLKTFLKYKLLTLNAVTFGFQKQKLKKE